MIKVMLTIGTRPEAIKMAPVVRALRDASDAFQTVVVYTGQHRELLDQLTDILELAPDADLRVMTDNQSLANLTSRLLTGIDELLAEHQPDVVLSQGDTTTVAVTGLACFYRRIPFEHVEAGLRTGDLTRPFPEEGNRRLTGVLATHHYAPTERSRQNLLAEGIASAQVEVTGNTVVDALHAMLDNPVALPFECPPAEWVLVTLHRRESFGQPFRHVLSALRDVLNAHPDVQAVYPVHPNPNVRRVVEEVVGACENIRLIEPLRYDEFIAAMSRATVILSDSGGVQEEAPSVRTPLLVAREMTERPEGVDAGVAELVGYDADRIRERLEALLTSPSARDAMCGQSNPYGDGRAAARIVGSLRRRYGPR